MTDPRKPSLEGWYTEEQIGKGGFGAVYRIRREEALGIQETAALKELAIPQDENEIRVLRASGMDDKSISTQFNEQVQDIVREYKLMMGLKNCPNIVHCDDFQVIPKGLGFQILLRMELLSPLTAELPKGTLNSEKAVVTLGSHMCNALTVCHEKDILHRDVKPQNIFLAPDGNFKLGDFGIARTMEKNVQATSGIGTYNYMAPEVFNNQPYDSRADIYSLGMVLYNLLNGSRGPFLPPAPAPLNADHYADARFRRFSGEPLPPPARGSEALKAIVLKACAFDPRRRYLTAAQMQQDLEALSQGQTEDLIALHNDLQDFDDGATLDNGLEDKTIVDAAPRKKKPKLGILLAAGAALLAVAVGGILLTGKEEAPQIQAATETATETTQPAPVLAVPTLSQEAGEYDHRLELTAAHEDPEAELYYSLELMQPRDAYGSYESLSTGEVVFESKSIARHQRYSGALTLPRGVSTVTVYAVQGDLISDSVKAVYTVDYAPQEVSFRDKAVKAAVRESLNRDSGAITTHDCETITFLSVYDQEAASLEDLQYLPLVTGITLVDQTNTLDYTLLGNCPYLTSLSLSNCRVPDLNFLAEVPGLVSLITTDCGVEDVTGVSYLQSIQELTLEERDMDLEAALAGDFPLDTLQSLHITGAQLSSPSLAGLNGLETLTVSYLDQVDMTPLGVLTDLKSLTLIPLEGVGGNFNIYDGVAVYQVGKGTNPDIIQDFSFLEKLTNLTTLDLDEMVRDSQQLTHLYGLQKLTELSLVDCEASEDEAAMTALQEALPQCTINYDVMYAIGSEIFSFSGSDAAAFSDLVDSLMEENGSDISILDGDTYFITP